MNDPAKLWTAPNVLALGGADSALEPPKLYSSGESNFEGQPS